MNNQTSRILVALLISGFVLLGIGCTTEPSQNNQNISNQSNSNQMTADNKLSDNKKMEMCTNVDVVMIREVLPKELRKQLDKNFFLSYSDHELILKGSIYSDFSVLQEFINALDQFRSPSCVRLILFQGNKENNKFRWCPTNDCKGKVPDQVNCNKAYIDTLFRDSEINDELSSGRLLNPFNSGNDGELELIGIVGDPPNSRRFKSLFPQLQKGIIKGCITKILFSSKEEIKDTKLLNQGFAWQICSGGECECSDGTCQPTCDLCPRTVDNTNTTTNGNTNTNNSNVP